MSLYQKHMPTAVVGATVDTADAGDGLPFTLANSNTNSTRTYSDQNVGPNGTRSIKFSMTGTTANETQVRRNLTTPSNQVSVSWVIYIPTTLPPTGAQIFRAVSAAGTCLYLHFSSGKLQILDSTTAALWSSAASLPTGTLLRLVLTLQNGDIAAGSATLTIFNATSNTQIDTISLTGKNFRADELTYLGWGYFTAGSYTGDIYVSNIQWREGTTVPIPPYVLAAAPAAMAFARATVSQSGFSAVGATTIDAALADNPGNDGIIDATRGAECTPDAAGKAIVVELNALTAAPEKFAVWVKGAGTLNADLLQGTTVIASRTGQVFNNAAGVEYSYTLTPAEVAAITDWSMLRVRATIKS